MSKKPSITDQDYKYVFNEILDMTDDGFLLVDQNGIVANINEKYAHFLGKAKESLIGKDVSEIIANTEMFSIQKNNRRDVNFVSVVNQTEITSESKDKILSITRSPIKNDSKEIIGAVAQVRFRDIILNIAKSLNETYKTLNILDKDIFDKIETYNKLSVETDIIKKLQLQIEYYKDELRKNKENKPDYTIGTSPNFLEVKTTALRAGKNSFSVLLTGETGTGKEVIANLIHWASDRSEQPFVKINCASIPTELFESELFGYESGAFTGALKGGKKGKFELAHKGSIFLDEIGDMPMNMQTKLLRVLQDGIIEPLGSVKPISVDVRIISATNVNLEETIKENKFRQDLYYRLNEIKINMPKLSDRKIDIVPIAQHALYKLNWQYETDVSFSPDIFDYLIRYNWPGNIRELINVVKNAYSRVDGNKIEVGHLPENITSNPINHYDLCRNKTLEDYLNLSERTFIISSLKENKCNCTRTAAALGIHRSNLYKKIEKYKINKSELE